MLQKPQSFNIKMKLFVFCIIFCTFPFTVYTQLYKAAVVDYKTMRLPRDTPQTSIKKNIVRYQDIMEKAYQNGVNIIVFPEDGLTSDEYKDTSILSSYSTQLPDSFTTNFCDDQSNSAYDYLQRFSCAAKACNMYTVINLIGMTETTNNTSDFYSTTIVFNNTGFIVEAYRKTRAKNNPLIKNGTEAIGKFSTHFGTFGVLIGEDFILDDPKVLKGIDNLIVTSAIRGPLGLSLQAGFALNNNINLLVASYKDDSMEQFGGGIYVSNKIYTKTSGNGLIMEDVSHIKQSNNYKVDEEKTKFRHVSEVKSRKYTNSSGSFNFNLRYDVKDLNTKFADCTISVDFVDSDDKKLYKKAYFFGNGTLFDYPATYLLCTVIYCKNASSCKFPSTNNIHLKDVSVEIAYPKKKIMQIFPIALQFDLVPLDGFKYSVTDDTVITTVKVSVDKVNSLQTFGVLVTLVKNYKSFSEPGMNTSTIICICIGVAMAFIPLAFCVRYLRK